MHSIQIKNWSLGKKLFWSVAIILVIALIAVSCGSSSKSTAPSMEENQSASYDMAAPAEKPGAAAAPVPVPQGEAGLDDSYKSTTSPPTSDNIMSQRKVIMDGNVTIETQNFDDSIAAMDQLIIDYGGFSETRTVKGKSSQSRALRSANYIIRVPAESFEAVLQNMGSIGTVLESGSQGTDITDQYTDYETRVRTLKVQEETLLDILAKSTNLEDVITLESRIAEVRYEIERIENSLRNYDRLVAFSRITVYIQEVDDRTETRPVLKTLNERIEGSFIQSLEDFKRGFEDFLVWVVGAWIKILFLLVVSAIIIIWLKVRIRKKVSVRQKAIAPEVNSEEGSKKE